jgi:hypothetical protein
MTPEIYMILSTTLRVHSSASDRFRSTRVFCIVRLAAATNPYLLGFLLMLLLDPSLLENSAISIFAL